MSRFLIVAFASVASAVVALKKDDPCEFNDALWKLPTTEGVKYFLKQSRLQECIDATVITRSNALWTAHSMLFGVSESYSFTELATNVSASDHYNECGFKTHEVAVDLDGELRSIIADFGRVLDNMDESQHEMYLKETMPGYPFHNKLLNMMNALHDAHTLYQTPYSMFATFLPISFSSRMGEGSQRVTLRYSDSESLALLAKYYYEMFGKEVVSKSRAGSEVVDIDGIPALDWLLNFVNYMNPTEYQSDVQRLNGHIFSADHIELSAVSHNLPSKDYVTIKFRDGVSVDIYYMSFFFDRVAYDRSLTSTTSLNEFLNSGSSFRHYMKYEKSCSSSKEKSSLWQQATNTAGGGLGGLVSDPSAASFEKYMLELEQPSSANRKKRVKWGTTPGFGHDLLQDDHFDLLDASEYEILDSNKYDGFEDDELGAADSFIEDDGLSYKVEGTSLVVKVPSFTLLSRYDGDSEFMYFPSFVKAVKYAQDKHADRLLLDLTRNGGGYVESAYALLWFMDLPAADICAPVSKRMTWNSKVFLNSYGIGYDKMIDKLLLQYGDKLGSPDVISHLFSQFEKLTDFMQKALELIQSSDAKGANCTLAKTKEKFLDMKSDAERASTLSDWLRRRAFLEIPGWDLNWTSLNVGASDLYYPFDAQVDPETGEVFNPPAKQYTNIETKEWGNKFGHYSKRGLFDTCYKTIRTMEELFQDYDKTYFKEISFMTDGTCGSACALFTQGVQLSGRATAFSYGALADYPVDVASFAGGTVLEYGPYWRRTALAAKLGEILTFGASDYAKLHAKSWVNTPVPLPTPARARFNFNMMFSPSMGASALPRQFYIIPAHRHLNMWAHNDKTRDRVYRAIDALDWCVVRANRQFPEYGSCPAERQCGPNPSQSDKEKSTLDSFNKLSLDTKKEVCKSVV